MKGSLNELDKRNKRKREQATVNRKLSITRGSSVKNGSDSHVSFYYNRLGVFGIPVFQQPVPDQHPRTTRDQNPFNMWTGLTSNISPRRNTIATQETISAWFWMTNSWLITGGFLFVFFRIPMSTRFGPTFFASRCADVVVFFPILLSPFSARTLKAPSCFL